ncbi:DUF2809 domain-containing protein [Nonomuraea sp. 3N208]|uniref:ribosomal maturation YjgA family protein n=1 Tax=Nonomuraea sp. 3N208 TaxID=3457421 RepID=UPI003FCFCD9F
MPRLPVALAAALTIAAGLGVRLLWDGPVSKYAGDALYTVLIYALVLFARPRMRPWAAASVAAGLSWTIEFAQLSEIPTPLRLVLGSTFNPPDLLWYAVGAGAAWGAHALWLRRRTALITSAKRTTPNGFHRPADGKPMEARTNMRDAASRPPAPPHGGDARRAR